MGASLILEKCFSRSNFYDTARFSILASGSHLMLLLLKRIFSKGPVLILSYLIVGHLCGCFSCFRGLF